jgi:hypothetical protein
MAKLLAVLRCIYATPINNCFYCLCLGHLGRCNINKSDHVCIALPKVAKASAVMAIASLVAYVYALILTINFAILNAALSKLRGEMKSHLYPPLIFPMTVKDLGHLGRCNTNRNDFVCIALPKVAKASEVVTATSHCCQYLCLDFKNKLCYSKCSLNQSRW